MPSSDTSPINRFKNDFPRQFIQLESINSGPYGYGQIYQHKISHELVLERLNQNRQPDQKEFSRILNTLSADVISQIQLQDNIYYEYIPHTLFEEIRIRAHDQVPFQEADIWYVIFKLATILTHIKSRAIYHMDLRPYNILIEQNGNIKLAPMGTFSDDINCVEKYLSHGIATNVPFDVQAHHQNIQWDQVDIFGLGVTLMNMISCQNRHFENEEEIVQFFNTYKKYYSSHLIDLIKGLVLYSDRPPKIEDIYNKLLPYKQQINTFQSFEFSANLSTTSPSQKQTYNQQSYNSPGQAIINNTQYQQNQAINLQPVTGERREQQIQNFSNQNHYNQQVDTRYQSPQSQQVHQTQSIKNQISGNVNNVYVSSRIVENQSLNQAQYQSPNKIQSNPNECSNCHKQLSYQEILSYSQQKQQWSRLSHEQQQLNSPNQINHQQQQQVVSEIQNINTLVKSNQKIEIQEQRQFGIFDEQDQQIWQQQQIQVPQTQIIDIKYRQLQNQNQITQNYAQSQDQYYNQSRYQQISQNVNKSQYNQINGQQVQYQQQQNQGLELSFQNSQIQQGVTQTINQSQHNQTNLQTQVQYNQQQNQGYQQETQTQNKQASREVYNNQNQNTEQYSQNFQQNSQSVSNQGVQGIQNQELNTQISQNRMMTPLTYNQPLLETIRNSRHQQQISVDQGNQFQQQNQQTNVTYQQDQSQLQVVNTNATFQQQNTNQSINQQQQQLQIEAQQINSNQQFAQQQQGVFDDQQNNTYSQQLNSQQVQYDQADLQLAQQNQIQQAQVNQNTQIQQLPIYSQQLPELQQATVQNQAIVQQQVAPLRPQVFIQPPAIQPISQQGSSPQNIQTMQYQLPQALPQQQISNTTYIQQTHATPQQIIQNQQLPIYPQELPQLQQASVQNISNFQQIAPQRTQVFLQPPALQATTQQTSLRQSQSGQQFGAVQAQAQNIQTLTYQIPQAQQQISSTTYVQQAHPISQQPQLQQASVQNVTNFQQVASLRPQVLFQPSVQATSQQTQLAYGGQSFAVQGSQPLQYNSTYAQQTYSTPQQIIQPQTLVYQNPTLIPQLNQSAYNRPQQLIASQQLPKQQVLFQSSQVSLPSIQQTNPINVPSSIVTNVQK